jgi:hypothetical protein
LDQTFFGFNAKHQVEFHDQLFNLVWAGEGRWSWETIYHLPLHIRRLWISKINKMRDESNMEQEAAEQKQRQQRTPTIKKRN